LHLQSNNCPNAISALSPYDYSILSHRAEEGQHSELDFLGETQLKWLGPVHAEAVAAVSARGERGRRLIKESI